MRELDERARTAVVEPHEPAVPRHRRASPGARRPAPARPRRAAARARRAPMRPRSSMTTPDGQRSSCCRTSWAYDLGAGSGRCSCCQVSVSGSSSSTARVCSGLPLVCSHSRRAASGVMATPKRSAERRDVTRLEPPDTEYRAHRRRGELAPALRERLVGAFRARRAARAPGCRRGGGRRTAARAATRRRPGGPRRRRPPIRVAGAGGHQLEQLHPDRYVVSGDAARPCSRPAAAQQLVGHRERDVRLGLVTARRATPGRVDSWATNRSTSVVLPIPASPSITTVWA